MAKKDTVYWHNAGYGAFRLELYDYRDVLSFEDEHQLSDQALKIDIIIIKKPPNVEIAKNIGRIFRSYNIVEYVPENRTLSIRDYDRVMGYAYLYSSFNGVPVQDISVTFSVMVRPRKLLKKLTNERGRVVNYNDEGIFSIQGEVYPVQILLGKQLPKSENIFLRNLRSGLSAEEFENTAQAGRSIGPLDWKDAYFDRLMQANQTSFREVIAMSRAGREIYFKVGEETGLLESRDKTVATIAASENSKAIAKKLLLMGNTVEVVSEATGLPVEVLASML